jgi:hypothetical protein
MKMLFLSLFMVLTLISQGIAESPVKYNKELDGFKYPFEVNTHKFNSQNQDLKMRYMDIGEKE